MKGSYELLVKSKKVSYRFIIKRNVTIVRGDSGIGKTTLLNLLEISKQSNSPVTVACNIDYNVVTGDNWKRDILCAPNSLIFIDDINDFIYTGDFSLFLKEGDKGKPHLTILFYLHDEI